MGGRGAFMAPPICRAALHDVCQRAQGLPSHARHASYTSHALIVAAACACLGGGLHNRASRAGGNARPAHPASPAPGLEQALLCCCLHTFLHHR